MQARADQVGLRVLRAAARLAAQRGLGGAREVLYIAGAMQTTEHVRRILADTLGLGARGGAMVPATPLLGALPELDSMAVVNLVAALEEQFGFTVADDEISAETFATLGSLSAFVEHKLAG